MLKITEIAFGLEKTWRHRMHDAVTVPHHISFLALILGISVSQAGVMAAVSEAGGLHAVLLGVAVVLLCVLVRMRRRVTRAAGVRQVSAWLGVWCALWFVTGMCHGLPRVPERMPAGVHCEVAAEIAEIAPGAGMAVVAIRRYACAQGVEGVGDFKVMMRLDASELAVDRAPVLARGTRFVAEGVFERAEAPDVPGMYDPRSQARIQGIYGTFRRDWDRSARRAVQLRIVGVEPSMRRSLEIGRRQAYDALSAVSPEGILPALVLGAPRGIDRAVRETFGRLGIAHVLAVSGLHFGMIAILVNYIFIKIFERVPWIMRRFGKKRAAMVCALPMLCIYLFFVGAPVSAQRALLMTVMCFGARIAARSPERSRALAGAGLLIVGISPGAVLDVGFQLSFSAVFGILCALDIQQRLIEMRLLESGLSERSRKAVRYLVGALLVTVCTALTTAPFVIAHFGRLPLLGIFTNLIVIPYVSFVLMPLAMITALFAVFGLPCTAHVAQLGAFAEKMLVVFADLSVTYIPFESASVQGVGASVVFGILAVALIWRLKISRLRLGGAAVMIAVAVFCVACGPLRLSDGPELRISFIAMGQADSTLIEYPDGTVMLIDAGSEVGRVENAAERRLLPYLQARDVRAIDILVLTHGDYDHVAGVMPLLEGIEVREIWYNGAPAQASEPPWREAAAQRDIPVWRVQALPRARAIGDTSVEILWPVEASSGNDNESSVVLRLAIGSFSAMFMGDAGVDTEDALILSGDARKTVLLKAGHHGSKSASSEAFLDTVHPDFAVFSVGRNNRYHFPHPSVERRMAAHAQAYRTDRSGTVVFRTDGSRLRVQTMR